MIKNIIFILIGTVVFSGCSIRKFFVDQTRPIIDELQKSVLSESHEEISKGSLPFAIKFSEGLYYYYPKSPYYSSKLALLYGTYTFAYVDSGPYSDFNEQAEKKNKQTIALYKKAFDFGMASMNVRIEGFSDGIYKKDKINELLSQVSQKDVEALFWVNFAWALMIFEDLSDVKNLAALDSIKKIAEKIIEMDEGYLYGASYAILCAYYGARSEAIGGDFKKAEEMYQQSLKFSRGNSLIPAYVMLRFVSIERIDAKIFDYYYGVIKDFDTTKNKDFSFVNVFLKRKAEILNLKRKDIFF